MWCYVVEDFNGHVAVSSLGDPWVGQSKTICPFKQNKWDSLFPLMGFNTPFVLQNFVPLDDLVFFDTSSSATPVPSVPNNAKATMDRNMRSFLKTLPWQENRSKSFGMCCRKDGSCGAKNIQSLCCSGDDRETATTSVIFEILRKSN